MEFALVGVGRGVLQRGGDIGLLRLELGNSFLQLADFLAVFADFVRGGFFCGGHGGGFRGGRGGGGLLGTGVGEAGGEREAGVGGLGFLQIIIVVAGVGREAAAVDVEHGLRKGADEVHVVTDEDERAFVILQRADEGVDRLDVQVGRRLVHEEEIRRFDEDAGEGEAGFFAAGEDADGFVDVVFAEEEGAEDGAGLLFGELVFERAQRHHVFEDGHAGVEVVEAVLGEVAGDDVAAEFAGAALGRDDVGEDFEEGRFAGAVGADEDDALAAFAGEVEVLVDDVLAVGLLDVGEGDDLEAGARGLRELEVHLAQFLGGLLDGDLLEAFDLLFFRLGAGGHGGLGAEAVDEDLEVGDLALLGLEGGGLLGFARLFFLQVIVVVAVVIAEGAGAELEHAGAEGVEEGAVVRDDDEAAGVADEVVLEPEEGLEIEMVGRLVEQEEGGLGDEEPGEVGAHDPAAGEGFRELEGVAFLEAEAGEDFFRAGLEGVIDVVVVLVGLEFLAAGGDVENGFVAGGGALLREVTEVGAALPLDGAGVGLFLAEDEAEQRGFAGAVGADKAEAVGAGNEQGDIREEFAGAIGLGDVGDGKHRNRAANTRPGRGVNGGLWAGRKRRAGPQMGFIWPA